MVLVTYRSVCEGEQSVIGPVSQMLDTHFHYCNAKQYFSHSNILHKIPRCHFSLYIRCIVVQEVRPHYNLKTKAFL